MFSIRRIKNISVAVLFLFHNPVWEGFFILQNYRNSICHQSVAEIPQKSNFRVFYISPHRVTETSSDLRYKAN